MAEEDAHRQSARELRRSARPAVFGIEDPAACRRGGVEHRRVRRAGGARIGLEVRLHLCGERGGRPGDARGLLRERRRQRPQHGREAHPDAAVAVAGGIVGAPVEGLAVGGEPQGHRPTAAARERLHGGHVDRVDIGSLLAVDLDGDVVLVQVAGDVLVLEGLLLHDVTPVARGVADREQHRPAEAPRGVERLVAPGIPAHRVVGVLPEIRARLQEEAIGVAGRAARQQMARARRVAGGSSRPGGAETIERRAVERRGAGQCLARQRRRAGSAGDRERQGECRKTDGQSGRPPWRDGRHIAATSRPARATSTTQ